jgi:outer membrane protein OmpA-like peptidoglycan-associated protein
MRAGHLFRVPANNAVLAFGMAVSTYQWGNVRRSSFQVERWSWSLRGWLLFALILAVAFHWWLYYLFNNLDIGRRMITQGPGEIPKPERISINPELLKEQKAVKEIPDILAPSDKPPEPQVKADIQDIVDMLPKDKAIDLTPEVNKVTNFIAKDKTPEALQPANAPSLAAVADNLPGMDLTSAASALKSSALTKPLSANQLTLPALPSDKQLAGTDSKLLDRLSHQQDSGNGANKRVRGFSNLDDLLDRGGKLSASTAPILMPTDLLFEYGSDELQEGARLSLMKLGYLIMRNPNSRFIIEGHTDTFGTDQFNFDLSQRRANAVVRWLISSLHLDTSRVEAIGLGKSRLLIPAGSIEEQALNRRVEIKVRPLR